MKRFLKGFTYAAVGIWQCVLRERNFRFELCVGALVLWLGARYFCFSRSEWAVLLLTVFGVLGLEAMNSSVERAVALPDVQHDALAGLAKDMAAGAVLLQCLGAVAVGVALFWRPTVWAGIFCGWASHPYRPALLALYAAAGGIFVFRR